MNIVSTDIATKSERICGLDTIRFISAVVVLLGHYGPPLPDAFGTDATGFFKIARGVLSCLYNGPAAVIVFFVISGFCIHFPQRTLLRLQLIPYFCRRFTRIGVPSAIAIVLSVSLGLELSPPSFGVFWSIGCELVYYLIYPLLLMLRRSFGWVPILSASSLLTVLMWVTHVDEIHAAKNAYLAFGYMTWLNGLPCWILGCLLAESSHKTCSVTRMRIWVWRGLILGLSIALRIAKFHVISLFASNCISLNVFALVVFFWLRAEIIYHSEHPPSSILEWSGQFSFSLYLTHPVAPILAGMLFPAQSTHTFPGWSCAIIVSFTVAYAFYLLVESPSQKIAKLLSARLSRDYAEKHKRHQAATG